MCALLWEIIHKAAVAVLAGLLAMANPMPPAVPAHQAVREPKSSTSVVVGVATWYARASGGAAAGPRLRKALGSKWRGAQVRVCRGERCIVVKLVDWCACGKRGRMDTLLDLAVGDFARLAPVSAGVIKVSVIY